MIIIDDLHAASEGAIDLLHHLLLSRPELRLAIIGTVRSGAGETNGPGRHLARLQRLPMNRQLQLLPLEPVAAHELFHTLRGTIPEADDELIDRIEVLTGGNPLLITAWARDRSLARELERGNTEWSLVHSMSVAGLVSAFTDEFETPELTVIQAAAVIGRTFDVRVLRSAGARSGEFSPRILDEVLGRSVRGGWIHHHPGVPHRYTFAHELVQRAIYDDTRPAVRARLHLAVGRALEDFGSDPELLAHHFAAAWPACSAAVAARYLTAAGEHAIEMADPERADRLFTRGLDLLAEDQSADQDRLRGELMVHAGRARTLDLRPEESLPLLRRAREVADRHGWDDLTARAAAHLRRAEALL